MQPRASAAWNVRQRAVGLNVRDGTCAVQLHRLQSRLPRHHRNRQFCHSTPRSSAIPDGMRCAAQRGVSPSGGTVQHAPLCSTPKRISRHSAQRQSVQRQTNIRRRLQAAAANVQQALMQRTASSANHPADNTHRRQTGEDSVQRTTYSGNDAGDVRRPKACSAHHAADSMQRTTCRIDAQQTTCSAQRVADNVWQTTCDRQHAADSVQQRACSRHCAADNMLQTTCCRNHGMHTAHQTKWPRRTASMH